MARLVGDDGHEDVSIGGFMLKLRNKMVLFFVVGLILFTSNCNQASTLPGRDKSLSATSESPVTSIPLDGPVANADAEVSGLAWYGDTLIILPQYPDRWGNNLFALPKQDIFAFLDGDLSGPLTPMAIPLTAPDLTRIDGYEGLEAIAFIDDQVFITIEASTFTTTQGYLVAGSIVPDLSQLQLDTAVLTNIESQTGISNYSDETLLVHDDMLITIHEANGRNVNTDPIAHQFDTALAATGSISFPAIEYRVTDATAVDEQGQFWVINYLFPDSIDKLDPAADPLVSEYGIGPTHAGSTVVERLVELQIGETGITLVDTPPIQLELLDDGTARNWEGIARLEERNGFLLATDKFPSTILAFVAAP
jgi:hypothetical protein